MLTNDQAEAIRKLHRLKVGALFMKQGTGKTRVAVELVNTTDSELLLIVCPCATKENVRIEIERWGCKIPYEIIGYETLSLSDTTYLRALKLAKEKRTFIVADESIFIKNENSKRFNRMIELGRNCEYRLILNGTPITKDEWDVYNQMYFLSPLIIGMDRGEFLTTFFKKIRYKKKGQKAREFYKLSEVNIDYLHKLIEPYVYECDFNFEKSTNTEYICVDASIDVAEVYGEKKKVLLDSLKQGECEVKMFTDMAIVCFRDKERHKVIAQYIRGQMIVFCTLLEEVQNISKELDCYIITGAVEQEERNRIIERFRNDSKPLLITFGTGAFSLNLQFCNKVAFASLLFDYAKVDQAMSRIKRLGQNRNIEYTFFTSNLGIYNMILENIKKKKTLKELIVDRIERGGNFEECI